MIFADFQYLYAVLLLTHNIHILSNTWKYYFLIDYETQSESSDSAAFDRIVWCSCRMFQGIDAPVGCLKRWVLKLLQFRHG